MAWSSRSPGRSAAGPYPKVSATLRPSSRRWPDMPGGTFRFVPNPNMYREFARSHGVRDAVKDVADRGADVTRAIAPKFTGPTYNPTVQRHGEYAASVYSAATLH